jgi:hypothetical protein
MVITLDSQLPDTKDRKALELIIKSVSRKVERYLGRTIEIGTRTERFDVPRFTDGYYRVSAFPISSSEEIAPGVPNPLKLKNGGSVIDRDKYMVNYKKGTFAINKYDGTALVQVGFEQFEITYHGGMASDTDDFVSLYPDIAYEVALQVIFEFKRKKNMTVITAVAGGNNTEEYTEMTLRKELKRALGPYRLTSRVY